MMPNSTTKPKTIFLDHIENGLCCLYVRWNIIETTQEKPMSDIPKTSWDYTERIIWWYLDMKDIGSGTLSEIREYLVANEKVILNLAKATDLNYEGTSCRKETI
jgi:hypothetical protein